MHLNPCFGVFFHSLSLTLTLSDCTLSKPMLDIVFTFSSPGSSASRLGVLSLHPLPSFYLDWLSPCLFSCISHTYSMAILKASSAVSVARLASIVKLPPGVRLRFAMTSGFFGLRRKLHRHLWVSLGWCRTKMADFLGSCRSPPWPFLSLP